MPHLPRPSARPLVRAGLGAIAPLFALLLVPAGAGPVPAQQPIGNASFEAAAGAAPQGWQRHTWGGRAEFRYADGGRTGARSVAIRADDGVDGAWHTVVPVRMFSRYRLSGWIRTEGVTPRGGARGALLNVHDIQPVATAAVTGTQDWTRVAVEFDTGANDSIQVNCLLGGWGLASGAAWYDDLQLELLATETFAPQVRVDARDAGAPVPEYIYGQFIEHLGRCIQGGIWAELLEDRKFFRPVGASDSPWQPIGGAVVTMRTDAPFVGEHTPAVRPTGRGTPFGVAQGDLHLVAGKTYTGHVWLAGDAAAAPVAIRLCWGDGPQQRAVTTVATLAADYTRAPVSFTSAAATTAGRLEIVAHGDGELRVGTASLMPADHVHGMRADTLALLRELDAPIYRWPGGNFVSGYDWRDGVGDRDRRPPRKNPAWRGVEANDFGLDEFMTFCRVLDTEPYVVVNSGLGEVDAAVAWLEYCNGAPSTPMGALRARNGNEQPYDVTWWGIGNEMYGDWQLGHMPFDRYVAKHRRFAAAMRAADPSIRLVGVGAVGPWSEGMLARAAGDMDLISEHFYDQERRGTAAHAMQLRDSIRRIAAAHRDYRERIPGLAERGVRIALDEWNYWYGPHVYGELGTRYFLKDALGVAAGLHELARNGDLFAMANYAQTVNVIGCIKTTPTAAAFATTGLVLKLYRRQLGTLPVRVECPPPLDVMAAFTADEQVLTIAAVNPTREAIRAPLELTGVTLTGGGRRFRIAGDDPLAYNEPGAAPAVTIVEDRIRDCDRLELSPFSVTLLRLEVAARSAAAAPAAAAQEGPAPQDAAPQGANLASVATPSASHVSGDTSLAALADGHEPRSSRDAGRGSYGNWPRRGTQWVEYSWSQPIETDAVDVYWWNDRRGVRTPTACRLLYWDGAAFAPVPEARGLGLLLDRFNTTTFRAVRTDRLRLEIDGDGEFSTGVLEWKVYDAGGSPAFPPRVAAGPDRSVVLGGRTFLDGEVTVLERAGAPAPTARWRKVSGPGRVAFDDPAATTTTATFTATGDHVLELQADHGGLRGRATLRVRVAPPLPPGPPLEPVGLVRYAVSSPLWRQRLQAVVCGWLPHCVAQIEDPTRREGGLDNFVAAARKLRGEPHGEHRGYVFSNAWVLNTVEAISAALLLDPGDDAELRAAQQALRATLDDWIPKILAAQEPDGYLQTAFTLSDRERWSPRHRGDHEGYVAGYFLDAAVAHRQLTGDADDPLWRAAIRLADCWERNIGPPPKRAWYPGHQGLEMALVRFAREVDATAGDGAGDRYRVLARFLLDCRGQGDTGSEYDQSHAPVTRQYEAVGHAVRAVYGYAAMADVAMATRDPDYQSAVASLWDNLVHRKYYVTGGVGSGETSEGFGPDYSLRHRGYCESCSSCGMVFLQHRLHRAHRAAGYADLYEETLYNAVLGALDLAGQNFYYDNPLVTDRARYPWHVCPCCVGNIPRTLLMLPTWTYSKGPEDLYVNLFVGGRTTIPDVAGTDVEVVQQTDYPWRGEVAITINPQQPREFALRIRAPRRSTSALYAASPAGDGIAHIELDGAAITPPVEDGFAVVRRRWTRGDTVRLQLPLPVQRVTASDRVAATRGQVALRRGPLVYVVEQHDQALDGRFDPAAALAAEWRGDLLGGVVALRGSWADSAPLLAIPYYARANRLPPDGPRDAARPRSRVWLDVVAK